MEMNPMQQIMIEKVTINIGIGSKEQELQNAKALLKKLTGREAVPTNAKRRDPSLGIKKGQVIGAMVTLRKNAATEMLRKALDANNNQIRDRSITENSLSFGIKEYIDFTGVKYDPAIGMLGMNVNASFARRGRRIELRRRKRSKMAREHRTISKEDIIEYLTKNFEAKVVME